MSANSLKIRGRHRVNNESPETANQAGDGWGNDMLEAYTGKHVGHRAARNRLKVDIAP